MKPQYIRSLFIGIFTWGAIALTAPAAENKLVVHEWGTFTSFQGGDGVLLNWKPLVTSALPKFVYDWQNPGLGRVNFALVLGKGEMSSLQRMETPVVYFYSDKPLTADLAVQFPKGMITEWFPQAPEIGPSVIPTSPQRPTPSSVTNSIIHWTNIRVLSPDASKSSPLPTNNLGTHYFAARETDANLLQLDSLSPTNPQPQYEKFLFYRGVGYFATPLRVTLKSDDTVTLSNTGKEPLADMFVLDVENSAGGFIYVSQLLPGEEKTVTRVAPANFQAPAALTKKLSSEMSRALVKQGLYRREAAAMVNTWKSSWFAEDGTRVLYVLPRAWTDRTLPMTLAPAPRELTRVMLGRAEVLTPALENKLVSQLEKARQGDSTAIAELHQTAKSLGRFAEPAFYRALAKIKTIPTEQSRLSGIFFEKTAYAFE